MRRTTRLFEIIQALRSARKPMTAADLAATHEVTRRTIYRDIVSLQATGVPILGEAGVGYVMRPGYDLPPLMLSVEEMEAVTVALGLLRRTGDKGFKTAALSVQAKIDAVVPREARHRADVPSLYASDWGAHEPADVDLGMVRRAIRDERTLDIAYADEQGRRTTRLIRPIAIIYYVEVINIVGWCERRRAFRHFRADRISACAMGEAHFVGEGAGLRKAWDAQRGTPRAFRAETAPSPVQSGTPLLSPAHDDA